MNRKDTSIRKKLLSMIIFICSVVLLLMGAAYILMGYFNFRKALKNNVSTLSIAIATNSTAALAFDSPEDAEEILQALKADKNIIAACLYDKNGKLFAKYPGNLPASAFPAKAGSNGLFFKDQYLEGFQQAIQKDTLLGTLYIKADTSVLNRQLKQYTLIAIFLILASLLVTYLLTNFLQKALIKPIRLLQETAKIISESHNYSVRAVKISNDELGSLTEAFNQMLTQIEEQNLEIIKAKEESSKLAAIVESSGDAIIGSSLDHLITSWNESAYRMFGYTEDEITGKSVFTLVPRGKEKEQTELISRLEKGERAEPFETQMITKNKELLDVSLTLSPVKTSDGRIIGLSRIARDISKQKQNEQRIIQNEEHLRLATTAAEVGTFDLDLVNGTLLWDSRCRELFGIHHNEPVTYDNDFLNGVHQDDRERVSRIIDKTMRKEESEGSYDVEYRTVGQDKKIHWISAKGKVFFDDENKPVRFIGAVLDITDKKNEELKKNEFISIVSHELKTPLTSIKSYVQILLSRARNEVDQFTTNVLKRADVQTNKMTAMIHDFLNLSRIEEGKIQLVKERFDLYTLIKDVVNEILLLNSSCKIEIDLCDEIPVFADKNKIYQVFLNLLSNAVKYSPPGSTITVKCEMMDKKVRIGIIDEGIGINANDQKKLFSRFYRVNNERTKTVSGFGIGLFIVSEILRCHNSKIEVESKEGEGSAFYFEMELEPAGGV